MLIIGKINIQLCIVLPSQRSSVPVTNEPAYSFFHNRIDPVFIWIVLFCMHCNTIASSYKDEMNTINWVLLYMYL